MRHQFDPYTGRLTGTTNVLTPYNPLRPRPYSNAEPPALVFDQSSTRAVQVPGTTRVVPRKLVPGTTYFYSHLDETLKKNMEMFQKVDGVPVHLKRGAPDRLLFGTTVVLMGIGIVSVFNLVYKLAVPRKN